jgi:hypothetical protein
LEYHLPDGKMWLIRWSKKSRGIHGFTESEWLTCTKQADYNLILKMFWVCKLVPLTSRHQHCTSSWKWWPHCKCHPYQWHNHHCAQNFGSLEVRGMWPCQTRSGTWIRMHHHDKPHNMSQ